MSTTPTGGKAIIEIPVDTSAFDAFVEKYQAWRKDLETLPAEWGAANSEVKELENEFERTASAASRVNAIASKNNFLRDGGTFFKFQRGTKEVAKDWTHIAKHLEKSSLHMSGLARVALGLGAVGGVAVGGIGLALAGAVIATEAGAKTADTLAEKNKVNRAVGLKPGEEEAFSDDFGRVGGDSAFLGKISDAKSDPRQWPAFAAAGISPDEIQRSSVPDLAAEFLEKAGAAFKAHGSNAMFAEAAGFTNLIDTQGLRLAASYGPNDYAAMRDKYHADVPRIALDQAKYDQGSATDAQWKVAKDQFSKELLNLGSEFMPLATKVANAGTKIMDAFDKWGGVDKVIDVVGKEFVLLGQGLEPLVQGVIELSKDIKPFLPTNKGDALDKWAVGAAKEAPSILLDGSRWKALSDGFEHPQITHGDTSAPVASWDWKHPFGTLQKPSTTASSSDIHFVPDANKAAHVTQLEKKWNLPDGMLLRMEHEESSGGNPNKLRGPVLKDGQQAKGPMQFLDGTAKRYGLSNPDNEADSFEASAHYLSDLEARYHDMRKAVAAYNGASFDANDPNWESKLSASAKQYLDYVLPEQKQAAGGSQSAEGAVLKQVMGNMARTRDDDERQRQRDAQYSQVASRAVTANVLSTVSVRVSTPPGSNAAVSYGSLVQ